MFSKVLRRVVGVTLLATVAMFSAPSIAATTFNFSGTIDNSWGPAGFPNLNGTSITGSFVYDETAAESSSTPGKYDSAGAGIGATVSGGGYSTGLLGGATYNLLENDAGPFDKYLMRAEGETTLGGIGKFSIAVVLILLDITKTALSDTSLVFPSLGDFGLASFQIEVRDLVNKETGIYSGTLSAVPLPAGIPLAASGLAVLAWLGRRKKRAAAAVAPAA